MASLFKVKTKSGESYKLQEVVGGDRRTITLGKVSKKAAELICSRIETINSCNLAGLSYPADVAQWLGNVGDDLHGKIAKMGLVEKRHAASLDQELEKYIKNHSGGKEPETIVRWKIDRDRIIGFFGKNMSLTD